MIKITKVTALGEDRFQVEGFDDTDPTNILIAYGWVSALSNHYGPECYQKNGNLTKDAKPRDMNDDEKLAYFTELLEVKQMAGTSLFEDKDALAEHESAVQKQIEDTRAQAETEAQDVTGEGEGEIPKKDE